MILTGNNVADSMVENVIDHNVQIQTNGYDMTLTKVEGFFAGERGILDFSNSKRSKPKTAEIPFTNGKVDSEGHVFLRPGCYLITLDPKIRVPMDCIGRLRARSSLIRMGCGIDSGVWDANFYGSSQVLLTVKNLAGMKLYENARVGQMILERIEGGNVAEGYSGIYQEDDGAPQRHC
jgi:dUTP pyrophosphatase